MSVVAGMLAVIAAAASAWWAFAASSPAPEVVLPAASEITIPLPSVAEPEPAAIWVHVDGAVRAPGVHQLSAGARVIDAVNAAGGLDDDADRSRLNLALVLADQQRVWVPRVGEDIPEVADGTASGAAATSPAGGSGGLVDVNHADAAVLESLPGVGPALAAAIIEHRDRHGGFATLDDLIDVAGIGPAKLEQIRPFARA